MILQITDVRDREEDSFPAATPSQPCRRAREQKLGFRTGFRGLHPVIPALVICAILVLVACEPTPTPRPPVHITLVGSDSMQWIARALTSVYAPRHPGVSFSIQPTNSEAALRAVGRDAFTIGMVSRVLAPSELNGVRAVVIARDGIAIIVNSQNSINAIQRAQVTQVFSGQILTWPIGALAGKPIAVVSREEGSGTRVAFEAMVMNRQRVTPTALVMPNEAAVVDYVANHPEAVGYSSMGALGSGVHAMTVDDVALSTQTVESQQYPFVRTLAFLVPLQADLETRAFVDYAIGGEGQSIIAEKYGRAP